MPPKGKQQNTLNIQDDDQEACVPSLGRNAMVRGFIDHQNRKTLALNSEYWRFITRTGRRPMALKDTSGVWDVYLKWHEYNLEKHDKDDFVGLENEEVVVNGRVIQRKIPPITASETDVFKNYTDLEEEVVSIDTKAAVRRVRVWPLRLSNKINNKLKFLNPQSQLQVLESIFALQLGMISDAQILETGPIMYLAGFSKMMRGNQSLVFAIVPERIPIVQTVLDKTHIIGFKFRQYLRIIDIVFTTEKNLAYQSYQSFASYLQDDPDKWNPFLPGNFLESQGGRMISGSRGDFELLDIKNIIQISRDPVTTQIIYLPALESQYKMSTVEIRSFSLVSMRWVSELEESKFSFKVIPQYKNVNKMIIEKCTSEDSCVWLLDFLEKIPNFNLRLTAQEKRLITTPGNVLCIGRSGTGKTTSAVLRLFALEILFKIRSSLFFKGGESLKASNFTSQDAEQTTGLHSVIVTASPVLTNEIRRFYNALKQKVIQELKKREDKRKQRLQPEAASSGQESINEENLIAVEKEEMDKDGGTEIEEVEIEETINDDEVLDFEEMEKTMKMAQSMSDMRNEDFPAFLTIKRLVFMIDASLRRPFFARNVKNEIIGLGSQAEWHNEQKGVLMINNYYKMDQGQGKNKEDEIDKFMNLSSDEEDNEEEDEEEDDIIKEVNEQVEGSKRKRAKVIEGEKVVQEYAQEIDYETFERKFWPKHCFKESIRHITPAIVWTEIFSVIKGSHNSCEFVTKGLSREKYISATYRRTTLDEYEKQIIYNCYQKYETWKQQIKGFDFMDLVNHILRELQGVFYRGVPIHFMLVDEVQDLTAATIRLLLQVTEQNVYFAGDTAQTIAKGVGFRFCDLKQMLNMTDFQTPKVLQLTVNFRSHNQILTLANSVISAIELFFPLTIDKLIKEKSNIDGLKPIVLDSTLLDSLFYVLLGKSKSSDAKGLLSEKGGQTEFGCDQVIIVRDQNSKKNVPSVLQHALCLTVYECKGLEFEDVILYNFFNDAPQSILEQWRLINSLQVEKVQAPVSKKLSDEENGMQDLDDLNFEVLKEKQLEEEKAATTTNMQQDHKTEEYEYANRIYLGQQSHHKTNFYKEYSALCTDLKQLYVCITRPKKRLIIYDEDPSKREIAMRYWQKLGAVDVINEDMINTQNDKDLSEEQRNLLNKLREGQADEKLESDSEAAIQRKKGWRAQGIKMFKRRYYEQAIKCFDHSGDEALGKRALAYSQAEDASKTQAEAEQLQYRLEDTQQQLDKQQKRQIKEQIKGLEEKSKGLFKEAAAVFLEINLKKQAAQCLFTAQLYPEAAKLFVEIGFYSQAGESYYILEDYSRAAMLYNEGKMVMKAVECYQRMKNWDAILDCVKTHEEEFTQSQREQLIKKYVPLALNSLYTLITHDSMVEDGESDDDLEPQKKQIETVIKDYKVKSVIREEDESVAENGGVSDEEDAQQSDILTEPPVSEHNSINTIVKEEIKSESHDFELIDTTSVKSNKQKKATQKGSKLVSDSDFSIISSQQEETKGGDPADSFEHLSQFDPEDEFLKSRTVSVLESVISGSYKSRNEKSELSDYSIIDTNEPESLQYQNAAMKEIIKQNVNMIKTRRDIYAEDILMTKIIHYISQFSSDVKSYLGKLKSKDALLSLQAKESKKEPEVVQINTCTAEEMMYIDLEQIDQEFLNILLDCLESFELYKLCLIVCNRYQLNERVGRYIVSIAYKYSNLPTISTSFVTLFHQTHLEIQQQVSFIAHQALHSALELIEPKFLKIKQGKLDSANSLGQYCITGLLNLGFWKKLVYLVDLKSALTITAMFADFRNFRQIYIAFSESGIRSTHKYDQQQLEYCIKEDGFDFLGEVDTNFPSTQLEYMASIAALDSLIWSNNNNDISHGISMKEMKFPKEFQLSQMALKLTNKFCPLTIEEKDELLGKLVTKLDARMQRIYLGQPIAPEGSNQFHEDQCLYDTSVATFLLISTAFKVTMTTKVHILSSLSPEMYQVYLRTLNKFIFLVFGSSGTGTTSLKNTTLNSLMAGMFSVLRIRMQPSCDALYDNYGDKVLVHSHSGLALSLTKVIEEHKQKLADKITKEVFSELDQSIYTKSEINRIIKQRLRERFQVESRNCMVEIIDLEANFMRAPTTMVLDLISKQIASYVKHCTEKSLKSQENVATLKSKNDVDNLESPFDLVDKYYKILNLLNSSLEIQRFIQRKNPSIKQIASYLGKHKVYNQGSLEYHFQYEEHQKLQKDIKYKEYMVQIGLASAKDLETFKSKRLRNMKDKDAINVNQALYTSNITILSLLNFDPIPRSHLDIQSSQNLLDIGYAYWQFFRQTKSSQIDDDFGEFKFAITSLSLYIATDHYEYFMSMLQKQIAQKSIERQLLFHLLDAHIYKRSGHLLESSASLLKFVENAIDANVPLHNFYYINFIEMALVQLLSMRDQKSLYMPFEFVKYLSFHMRDLSTELKESFHAQVQSYFREDRYEDDVDIDMVSLPLRNSSYFVIHTDADQKRYKTLLSDVVSCLRKLSTNITLSFSFHLYLCVLTIAVNEPEIADKEKGQIKDIVDSLINDDIVYEDSLYLEHTSNVDFATSFFAQDYETQNSLIYFDKRTTQQSIWVKVDIEHNSNPVELKEAIDISLQVAEAKEAELLAKHQKVAALLRPLLLANKGKFTKKQQAQQLRCLGLKDRLLLSSMERDIPDFNETLTLKNIELLRKLSSLSKFIRIVTLNSQFSNVIDLHYLLNQIHKIENEFIPKLTMELQDEGSSLQEPEGGDITQEIDQLEQQVKIWSQNKQQPDDGSGQKRNQKIMKLRWREHALKVRNKLLAKVAARKKEDAYAKKKFRIKGRV